MWRWDNLLITGTIRVQNALDKHSLEEGHSTNNTAGGPHKKQKVPKSQLTSNVIKQAARRENTLLIPLHSTIKSSSTFNCCRSLQSVQRQPMDRQKKKKSHSVRVRQNLSEPKDLRTTHLPHWGQCQHQCYL